MGKKVLVAVDADSVAYHSISYGIQLAARMDSPLSLIIVESAKHPNKLASADVLTREFNNSQYPWLDKVLNESQRAGVRLEIFLTSGALVDELIRFVQSQPSIQFIIMASPQDTGGKEGTAPGPSLRRLHSLFEGEILLVQKGGHIVHVSDLHL
ncbi:MAG: universal stress protein [Desulfomonilaceae bacterium]